MNLLILWDVISNYYFNKYILKCVIKAPWFCVCDIVLGDIEQSILLTVVKKKSKVHALLPVLYRKDLAYTHVLVTEAEGWFRSTYTGIRLPI